MSYRAPDGYLDDGSEVPDGYLDDEIQDSGIRFHEFPPPTHCATKDCKGSCTICSWVDRDDDYDEDPFVCTNFEMTCEYDLDYEIDLVQHDLIKRVRKSKSKGRHFCCYHGQYGCGTSYRNHGRQPRRPQRDFRAREVREVEQFHRRHNAIKAAFYERVELWRSGLSIY